MRGISLTWTAVLFLSITYVTAEIIWQRDMNEFEFVEPPGDDYIKIEENKAFETNWNGKYIYTLRAVDSVTNSPAGIIYGFNNAPEDNTDTTLSATSSYFRINRTSGEVFMCCNKLDYEDPSNRNIRLQLIAKREDESDFRKRTSTCRVLDFNDNRPKFRNDTVSYTVRENTPVDDPISGTLAIKNIVMTDVDNVRSAGVNYLRASVLFCTISNEEVPCSDRFRLNATALNEKKFNGDLYVLKPLDYEVAGVFQVVITVDDGYFNQRYDVTVNVIDEQDLGPIWTVLPNRITILDQPALSLGDTMFIQDIQIQAEDQDTGKRAIFYEIIPSDYQGIPIQNVWEINNRTGIITNKVNLDLEDTTYFRSYDPKILRDLWLIRVKACEIISENPFKLGNDSECTTIGTVPVSIKDVNDNRPILDRGLYVYSLLETAPSGFILNDPPIIPFDGDTELYNAFTSEFIGNSEEFEVGGIPTAPHIQVKNSDLIDYDRGPKMYRLTLRTYDIDDNSKSSVAEILVNILDVNDNRPTFPQAAYNATIPEDSPVGTAVKRIQATDIDSGEFGTDGIRYELYGSYLDLFTINSETGLVEVASCDTYGVRPCLDYDTAPTIYRLTIRARDSKGSLNGKFSTVSLNVYLTNVNDNPPVVGDYEREIIENEREFDPELKVQGTDLDGPLTQLEYSIESQSPGQFFAINPSTGVIFVNKPNGAGIKYVDGKPDGRFEVLVTVTDGKYTANSKVSISVRDINDNAPNFIPSYYEISINETTPPGTSLLQLTAVDADDPTSDNGKLEYTITTGNLGGKFGVNRITGEVFVTEGAVFDYDVINRYQMQAVVNDKGTNRLTGNATIVINILDNNNKDPYIDPFLQEFTVYDDALPGFKVGSIKAYDPDLDALLRYVFTEPKEASSNEGNVVDPNIVDFRDLFTIEYETGDIYVNKELSSVLTAIVSYGVEVRDITPTPYQVGPGRIVIYVLPFNKVPPRFDPYETPIYINEEQPIGSVILSFIAQDDNGIRMYTIFEQPDDNFVAINPNTGSVSILNRIDYDDARQVFNTYFKAMAIDLGDPELSATASVSVIFMNINDNFPEFIDPIRGTKKNIYTARIPENSPDGTFIATAYAFDKDYPDNNTYDQVRYFMDDDRFDVDPMNGTIFVRLRNGAVLDREKNARLNARVFAIDNPKGPASNQNRRAASVQVVLTDVNDNCPAFSSNEYQVTIFETIGVGTDILQLFSTDRDIGENAIAYYSKISGSGTDYDDFFDVRREFGRVYVKRSLVRHTGTYRFFIRATDNVGSGCSKNTTVIVKVMPSANAPPIWVIPPIDNMTIFVLEEQYNGMLVYDVSARDEDSGVNGLVDYSFIYNGIDTQATPDFKINKVTGVIQAEIVYDREKVDKYVLLLKARDNGKTRLETTRFLTVVVLDVNDNYPVFNEREYQIDITENEPLGDIKQIPSATDLDLNPVIYYDIISGNEDGVFELDRNTRMLSLVKPVDRESKGIYYIDVQATNGEADYTVIRNRRRRAADLSIITLKIIIGDINDLAPAFLQDEYYGCVSARAPYDKHILTVQAVDRDAIGTPVVRYSVIGGNVVRNKTLFDIHPKFGVVTNKVLMRSYADTTFFITINARDREDSETAESANTVAKVFVNQPGNEVKLLITQNTGEVRLYQSQIQSILEEATDLTYVCINDIQDHVVDSVGSVTTLWSDVYITGIRREVVDGNDRFIILSNTEMKNIVNRERYDRKSDFDLLYIKEVEAASSSQEIELEDQAVLIILIIIAVLIFLVIIFCIVAFLCIRAAKRQKKAMLLHKTHATPPPQMMIEQEPVIVEPVIYDNRAFVTEEQNIVIQDDPPRVVQPDPVHVQYAVVQKRSPSPQYVEETTYFEDDQDAIVVELKDDVPRQQDVYDTEPEYRIETEVVTDQERM
ncbi:cadherin-87A-like isoform X2 [Ruditapes philippinarum]|uniref:cadherin-87A-like isoform X2 n=1 Tax=Ruditapes philippinarum TaxID=129788 RepID=UPI00295A63B8|nr:cadherin-87A-like isoform X2 [Ruditapes philippinarum]